MAVGIPIAVGAEVGAADAVGSDVGTVAGAGSGSEQAAKRATKTVNISSFATVGFSVFVGVRRDILQQQCRPNDKRPGWCRANAF